MVAKRIILLTLSLIPRWESLHTIAKVFFANLDENLDNFQNNKRFGRKHSACSDLWASGVLTAVYSISVGCGVRLFLSCCVRPEHSSGVTKTAPHLYCFNVQLGARCA